MPKPNLYKLEAFYYRELKLHINTQLYMHDVYRYFGTPLHYTVKELFKEKLELEEEGQKFEYSIKGFIYPTAYRYRNIYHRARTRAYTEFLREYKYYY